MPKYFPRQLLFRLRNEIPLEQLIAVGRRNDVLNGCPKTGRQLL